MGNCIMVNIPDCTWQANSEVHKNRSIRTVVITVMVTSAPTACSLHEKMGSDCYTEIWYVISSVFSKCENILY